MGGSTDTPDTTEKPAQRFSAVHHATPPEIPEPILERVLASEAPDLLAADQKQKVVRVLQKVSALTIQSGPLPSPDDMARYNAIIPNGADRIMRMAENQAKHRMELERTVVTSQQRQSERGQFFGLSIAILCIGAAVALTVLGHAGVGGLLGGGTVISLTGLFVYGKISQQRDLDRKREAIHAPAEGADPGPSSQAGRV